MSEIQDYVGPPLKCIFCIYESRFSQLFLIPNATHIIPTPKGMREVCAAHATIKMWRKK